MTKAAQVKLVKEAFSAIPEIFDGFRSISDRLFHMNETSERDHRKTRTGPYGISVEVAAKLFTVQHLLDGYADPHKFNIDDILTVRNEVLYAQAYAKRYHMQLRLWAEQYGKQFQQISYSDLMNGGR